MNILRRYFCTKHNSGALQAAVQTSFFDFFISSELITMHKFVKINAITPNYVYNNILQWIHQYRYPTTLNLLEP
jgi:hypothetical protein